MSDVAFRPNDTAAPETPPAETVTLESKAEWQQAAIEQGVPLDLDRPFSPAEVAELANSGKTTGRDDLLAREMSRELNRQRERDGHINDLPPLIEIKAPKGRESYKSAEELTRDTTFNRRLSVYQEQLAAGADPQTAEAIAMKDGQFEPQPVPLANERGELLEPLGRVTNPEDATFDNVYQATRVLRNGREAAAAALQAELAEYQQTETASSIDSASETAPAPEPQAPTRPRWSPNRSPWRGSKQTCW